MIATDYFSKNKNKLVNGGVIILAVFIAFYLYGLQAQQLVSLRESKNEEIKKSEIIESLNKVEKKISKYKQIFTKKDLGSVIDAMTEIARDSQVQVISVKPGPEERKADYIKTSFFIVVRVADYHALGNFISKVENYKDLFMVEEVNISSVSGNQPDMGAEDAPGLDISLRISTITYL
jgi:Tfp pilus assembly protein PilO